MMLFLYLLIIQLITTIPGEQIKLGDVHRLARDFASLTSASSDFLEHLKFIRKNAQHFMKICGPVGALVALGLDISFPHDSPEQLAIRELHEEVKNKFKALDVNLQSMEGNILNHLNLIYYSNDVTDKLLDLKALYAQAVSPFVSIRRASKVEFIKTCITYGPIRILMGIKKHTKDSCPTPNNSTELLYSSFLKIFFQIENKFNKNFNENLVGFSDYQSIKTDILKKLFFVNYNLAVLEMERLQKETNTLLSRKQNNLIGFVKVMRNLTISHYQSGNCILLSAFVANEDKTETGQFLVSMITNDIMKVLQFSGTCANASLSGDEIAMDEYMNDILNDAYDILDFVGKWISTKLDNQWPGTQISYALNTIKEDIVAVQNYNITAKNIGISLMKRGSLGFHFHILITEPWIGDVWYHGPICSADNCNLTTINGINIAIIRQNIESIELAISAKKWFNSTNSNIIAVIRDHADKPSLNLIIGYINGKTRGLITKDGYHSYLMVRNSKWFASDCVINYGIYYQPAFTELPLALIDYFINYTFLNAIRIMLFLFI